MYALIQNSEIKVGPRQYSKAFFGTFLTKQGVADTTPYSYDSQDPIVVSSEISIVPVAEPVTPSYNNLTEQLAGPFWNTTTVPVSGYYNVVDVDLDVVRSRLKSILAEARFKKESGLVDVTIQGHDVKVSAARDDRHIWFQSSVLLPLGATQNFKFSSDLWLQLSKTDIESVVAAIMGFVQDAFNWEAAKIAEIDVANKAGLEALLAEIVPAQQPTVPAL